MVLSDDKMSEHVPVKNSPKQGYVPAPLLLTVFYAAVLLAECGSSSEESCFHYFIGGRTAKLEGCQTKSKVTEVCSGGLPFAADSVLDMQNITDAFDCTAVA